MATVIDLKEMTKSLLATVSKYQMLHDIDLDYLKIISCTVFNEKLVSQQDLSFKETTRVASFLISILIEVLIEL